MEEERTCLCDVSFVGTTLPNGRGTGRGGLLVGWVSMFWRGGPARLSPFGEMRSLVLVVMDMSRMRWWRSWLSDNDGDDDDDDIDGDGDKTKNQDADGRDCGDHWPCRGVKEEEIAPFLLEFHLFLRIIFLVSIGFVAVCSNFSRHIIFFCLSWRHCCAKCNCAA